MTIVAGFPGKGFVVLAADSEEGGGLMKSSVRKIARIDKGDCKCLIGGAGHGDFIDLAVQTIEQQLAQPYTIASVATLIEEIVTEIYEDRIDHYPEAEREDLEFELLCALWVAGDARGPQLIRVRRLAHLFRQSPETIGIGSHLARYLIATLEPPQPSVFWSYRLAVYLLAQVKKYSQYCGGSSQVLGLMHDGQVVELWQRTIVQHEQSASIVMDGAAKFLFYSTDPLAANFDMDEIASAVDAAAKLVKDELRAKFGDIAIALKPPPAALEAAGIPPSPQVEAEALPVEAKKESDK